MKKKFIKLTEPCLDIKEEKIVLKVLKSKNLVDGFYQNKTENVIKKILNVNYCALTQSCSSALEVAAILLNLKKNDEVLLPSFTFSSTANAIILRGAKPVFVDIDKENLNIDINDLKKKITKRTKAIFLVHYAGMSCQLDEIIKLKNKHKIYIIEDVAHGFLGKYKNKYLGTFGDISTFSFHQTKNFTGGGQCGALVINNKKFINKADSILDKGTNRKNILKNKTLITTKNKFYTWVSIGSEYRASEISSAILYTQLIKKNFIQNKRKLIWNNYVNLLKNIKASNFNLLKNKYNNDHPYHLFLLIFRKRLEAFNFINFMQKNQISATFHYIPLHSSPFGKKIVKYKKLNITEKIYNKVVRLPLYSNMSENQMLHVNKIIKKFFKINSAKKK